MKGALYVLRNNPVGIPRLARSWSEGKLVRLVECLLSAHHENKASVQALVAKATEELIASMKEPTSHLIEYQCKGADKAVDQLIGSLRYKPDMELVKRLNDSIRNVKVVQDEQWNNLVDRVISIASNPQLNWRYSVAASRILYVVVRRDKPSDVRLAEYFAKSMTNAHPKIRDYGYV
jgi:proteasome activator subunit 4